MILRIASPALFLASLLPLIATQETDATCVLASSQWSFNSANQSPCSVASSLLGVCNGGSYDVKGLPEGNKYLGPSIDGANQCQCSTVTYSLISACALCQNRTISSWSEWSGNCPSVFISMYPSPIPQGTLVPGWAYLDVKTAGFFDEDNAKKNANATESTAISIPSSTSSVVTSTTSSAERAQTSSPDDIAAEQAARAEHRSDTIGSAVVGALVGLIVIVGIIAGLYVWKQRRKKAVQPNNHPTDADGSSVEKDSPMVKRITYGYNIERVLELTAAIDRIFTIQPTLLTSDDDASGMHPNKRRKLNEDEGRYVQAIIPEVDVEIGLRERLAETIEARIAWALALQESLTNGATTESELSFKDVALQALDEIESRTAVIFHNEQAAPVSFYPIKSSRPPPKEKPNTRSQKAKFIYLRSDDQIFLLRCSVCSKTAFNALQGLYNHGRMAHNLDWGTQEECVKACAVPQRQLDHELDLDNGIDLSNVAGGVRPGVRSLFEMAVEGTYGASTEDGEGGLHLTRTLGWHGETPALARFLGKEARRRRIKVWDEDQVVDVDGFAEDENTLINGDGQKKARWRMPYTHRSVSKEEANIEDAVSTRLPILENGVDLTSSNANAPVLNDQSGSRFHITCRTTVTDYSLYIPPEQRSSDVPDHTHKWMITVESSSYSLDLTTILKKLTVSPLPDETGISDPDLFEPISTTEPPFLVVGTTAEPFLAKVELKFTPSAMRPEGQTVILEHWVGLDVLGAGSTVKGDEQVTDVELDKDTIILPVKTGYTPIRSKQHWERTKVKKEAMENPEDTLVARIGEKPIDYTVILASLLPKFPITMKDRVTRGPAAPRVPYRLVADREQLKALVVGRRKAIEWARAKAIRDAYTETVSKESVPSIPLTVGDVFCWLEDEGHFIREERVEGQHEIKGKVKGKGRETSDDKWCRICGLGLSFHNPTTTLTPTVNTATAEPAPEAASAAITDFRCRIVPKEMQHFKMPTIDIEVAFKEYLLRAKGATTTPDSAAATRMAIPNVGMTEWARRHRNHDIVTAVEPNLTKFVHSQILALRLSNFPPITSDQREYPINLLGTDPCTVDAALAPHAYLALVMKQFVQYLVRSGLEIAKRDTEFGVGFTFQVQNRHGQDHYSNTPLLTPVMAAVPSASGSRKKSNGGGRKKEPANKVQSAVKVLTPMHILSGVISRNTESRTTQQYATLLGGLKAPEVASAVYRCLAQLGIGVHDNDALSE